MINTLLEEVLNTPAMRERGFTLSDDIFGKLRDREDCCPLEALARIRGLPILIKNHPWSTFVGWNQADIDDIICAADYAYTNGPARDVRTALVNFLIPEGA